MCQTREISWENRSTLRTGIIQYNILISWHFLDVDDDPAASKVFCSPTKHAPADEKIDHIISSSSQMGEPLKHAFSIISRANLRDEEASCVIIDKAGRRFPLRYCLMNFYVITTIAKFPRFQAFSAGRCWN